MSVRPILAVLAVGAALAGCEGQPDNGPPPVKRTQATVDKQIEWIRNNPSMSPQDKEAAIRGIQQSFEASQRAAQSASKNRAPG